MIRRSRWPWGLAFLFVSLLAWYLVYTEQIVRALRRDVQTMSQIFAEVQRGLTTPGAADETLFHLQSHVLRSGVPLVVTGPADTVLWAENLPFVVNLQTREGQARARTYARQLDLQNAPAGDDSLMRVHYGEPPDIQRLRWIRWLQAAGLLLTFVVGVTVVRYRRRAQGEQAWTAMARVLAHQLGTPLSSLQGWLEVLRLPLDERPEGIDDNEIAGEIEEDLVRLERVSRRFELIGREPVLVSLDLAEVVQELERYIQARLPRLGPGIRLHVDLPSSLPKVRGNAVLLVWALENVVKNAIDALAGRGGRISIRGAHTDVGWVTLRVKDTGPGVDPAVRDEIFETGVSTKSGGWGVGLVLSQRIIEGVHGGRIELLEGRGRGATFQVTLPAADD